MAEFITCPSCGICYGVPEHWIGSKRETKDQFYCPNGHTASFRKSTADKLAEQLSAAKQRQARLEDEAREERERANKAEAATKRLKKRAAAGNCPCCKRTFSNMSRHMQTKHPEFKAEAVNVVPLRA